MPKSILSMDVDMPDSEYSIDSADGVSLGSPSPPPRSTCDEADNYPPSFVLVTEDTRVPTPLHGLRSPSPPRSAHNEAQEDHLSHPSSSVLVAEDAPASTPTQTATHTPSASNPPDSRSRHPKRKHASSSDSVAGHPKRGRPKRRRPASARRPVVVPMALGPSRRQPLKMGMPTFQSRL
ncbi:hypothetical protein BDZ97DRAFT_1894522 [Flammula alnicola]|nr:hypothetical protein BDZ97DRAFT_1894522 [Flammula alnicola]